VAKAARNERKKQPSMYDVAQRAGVSQTTVSFVVNDVPNITIPEQTRERIWEAIKELGWRPNAMARGLSQRRSHTIGFISDEIATSSHAGKTIQGAQDAAWAADKMLLVINTSGDRRLEERGIEMMLERQVEGLIYATLFHHAIVPPSINSDIPLVLVDCFDAARSLPSIVPDEVQGGRTATEALIQRGHRRIGLVNNSDPIPARDGRLAGYKAALAAAGIPFDPTLIGSAPSPSTAASGYRCAMELLAHPEPPTALFCFNDQMAMGAYDAAKQRGLRIPQDIAIIGFDNLEVVAEHLYPPLTTIELPHYAMGEWAIKYLLGQISDTDASAAVQKLAPCRYIERMSL
jgi:LacI family transcriptional regulator